MAENSSSGDSTAAAESSVESRKRKLCLTVLFLTFAVYGAFVIHRYVLLTGDDTDPSEVQIDDMAAQRIFESEDDTQSNEAYVRAAELMDQKIMQKVREKYRPRPVKLREPRAHFDQRVNQLKKLQTDMKPSDYHDDSLETVERERMQRLREDKPQA